jgi:hypothetical protein
MNRFFLGLIIATLSFPLGAMEGKPTIDFSNVTPEGLEEFSLAYRLPYYAQLTPRTQASLEKRMKELKIEQDANTFISLISKLASRKPIVVTQMKTLKQLQIARAQRGHEEAHGISSRGDGYKVGTIQLDKK